MTEDEQDRGPDGAEGAFPGLPSFSTGGALSGMGELFGQAREQLERASHDAADVVVRGRAGGGAVEIELTGNLEVRSVKIAPDVVDPDDVGLLEDLVVAALRDALSEAVEVRERAASTLLPPGLDLGAMVSGLFGEGGLPDLSQVDIGDVDLAELVGELFGGSAGAGGEGDEDEDGGGVAGEPGSDLA